jgi:tetratricopeptide (TPR) repeat protein
VLRSHGVRQIPISSPGDVSGYDAAGFYWLLLAFTGSGRGQTALDRAGLGAALAQTGRYLEAKSHFERALQIEPNQPIGKENLEALQKEMNSHERNCLVPLPLFDLALSDNDLSFRAGQGTCCLLVPADSRLLVASLPGMPRPFRFRSFMIRCSEFCDLRIVL